MKCPRLLLSPLLMLLLPLSGQSQTPKLDPFAGHYLLRDRKQLAVLNTSTNLAVQQVYDVLHLPGYGDSLMAGVPYTYPDSLPLLVRYPHDCVVDMVTGNFKGDNLDEVVSAWLTQDSSIAVAVANVVPGSHEWSVQAIWKMVKPGLCIDPGYIHYTRIRLLSGQFDQDENEEFVLAYIAEDSTVTLNFFDAVSGFTFQNVAHVSEQKLFLPDTLYGDPHTYRVDRFDIASADMDGDGVDEVVLAGVEPDGEGGCTGFATVYDPELQSGTVTSRGKGAVFHMVGPVDSYADQPAVRVVAGAFDSVPGTEFCIAWRRWDYPRMVLARVSQDLQTVSVGTPLTVSDGLGTGSDAWLLLSSGDLNGDNVPEIVACSGRNLRVFRAGVDLDLVQLQARGPSVRQYDMYNAFEITPQHRAVFVADVNSDSSSGWTPEIVCYEGFANPYHTENRRIQVYEPVVDSARNITELRATSYKYVPYDAVGIMAAGRFDRTDVRLGTPTLVSKNNIVQPLVILNAPPVHFDVFGGTNYDVCSMYDGSPSGFIATYEKQSSSTMEVEAKITSTWAESMSLKWGFAPIGIGVEGDAKNRYGEDFSRVEGSSQTIRIGVKVDAVDDDYIYATVASYDFWEYPVFAGGDPVGHILVLNPNSASIQHGWFPSKNWTASSYVPNHEVGNILSYQRYSDLSANPAIDEMLKGNTNIFFSLNGTSSAEWYLNYSDFQSEGFTEKKSIKTAFSLTGGGMIEGIGAALGYDGEYEDDSISTHTSSVQSDLSLRVQLGSVNMGLGEVAYDVTPYTYWAKNGALVVDYAVKPQIAEGGGSPTWWQVHYNKPDPAFILPWRYDPEKGYTLQDPSKRFQTKEITFFPTNPERGDTVLIMARIRNFGLLNTDVPIAVRFYRGDPDSGGILLVGTDGISKLTTAGTIPARGTSTVLFHWQVPMDAPLFPRIYAVINPDTVMDEVHTNNNKGFAVLGIGSTSDGVEGGEIVPTGFALAQNYPNPFNPSTMIQYETPERAHVRLVVYDLLGRTVQTLVDEAVQAGRHQVRFNTRGLATGVYLYRIQAGKFAATRKMLLIK